MRRLEIAIVSLFVGFTLAPIRAGADEPKGKAAPRNQLVGTWKMVSAKYGGTEFKFPEGTTHLKHVTPTQFMWATYDRSGQVTRAAGGSYTLDGDVYKETPRYGIGVDFEAIKGKVQSFKCRVDGTSGITTAS